MKRFLYTLTVMALAVSPAQAHFVFIVPDKDGTKAKVVLSEDLEPDEAVGVAELAGLKLFIREVSGKPTPLSFEKGEHALTVKLTGTGPRIVYGSVDYSVMKRGESKPFLLRYHPKALVGDVAFEKSRLGELAALEIVPSGGPGKLRFQVLSKNKAVAAAEVTVLLPDGKTEKVKTDKDGYTPLFDQQGRFGAWTRHFEAANGEAGGKKYEEIRHYATLVLDVGTGKKSPASKTGRAATPPEYPPLPQAVSSLGAAVCDGWLYVYGGHSGKTHVYSTNTVVGTFQRCKLDGGKEWEKLQGDTPLQGPALVTHRGRLYRVGGMQPRNKPGEEADTCSLPICACFDPAFGKWQAMPDLPEGRSSHDAVVVGDRIIVVGGWQMNGAGKESDWLDTALVLDLAKKDARWEAVKQPFQRRALTAASFQDRVFVIAGMTADAKTHLTVNIYDPAKGTWTTGPDIPGGPRNGFSPASCVCDQRLYVSTADGKVFRLTEKGNAWEVVGQLKQPRFVHRLVAAGTDCLLAIGGGSMQGNVALTETVTPQLTIAPKR